MQQIAFFAIGPLLTSGSVKTVVNDYRVLQLHFGEPPESNASAGMRERDAA